MIDDITIGRTFASIHFDGVCTITGADVDANKIEVLIERISDSQRWHRTEEWNYEYTKVGFRNGDYFDCHPLTTQTTEG